MFRPSILPSAINAQYLKFSRLLTPKAKSIIKPTAQRFSTDLNRLDASRFHSLVISRAKKLFPKASQAQMNVIVFQMVCEALRNVRQEDMAAFENFDQKSNQLFTILASVMKSFKEMQDNVVRNIL